MSPLLCILAICWIFSALISAQISPITLTTVQGTPFNHPIGINFHEPSGTLLASANYYSGIPYNFERILFDGTHVQFSNVSGLTDEIKITAVRSEYRYSLAQGFQLGEMFTGNGVPGQILRIRTDANGLNPIITNPWSIFPGSNPGLIRGGLCFDQTGKWGGDLIVSTTTGKVYRVNATGYATLVGDAKQVDPNLSHMEAVVVIPDDPIRYGPYAANILTGGNERSDVMWTFAPGQPPVKWTLERLSRSMETLNVILPYNNFWGVDYQNGRLLATTWQDWQPYWNEILVGIEFISGGSGLYLVRYNNATGSFFTVEVPLTTSSDRPAQWEETTFAVAGINNIPPAVNVCFVGFWSGTSYSATPFKLDPGQPTPIPFYGYDTVARWSPNPHTNTPNVPRPKNDSIVFYWSLTNFNVLFLTILVDAPNSGSGGNALLELTAVNLANSPITIIQRDDDPSVNANNYDFGDSFYWNSTTGDGLFQWRWGSTTSDGVILGPFPLYQADNIKRGYCVKPRLLSSSGLDPNTPMYLASYDPRTQNTSYTPMGVDPEICVYLCPQFCFLYSTCIDCVAKPECTWCPRTQTCQNRGNSPYQNCFENETISTCPCNSFTARGCDVCSSQPGCEWCCQNNLGSCMAAGQCTAGGGTPYTNGTCSTMGQCPSPCQNGGQCICSRCQCPAGLFGDDCSATRDCLGVINGTATVDICGVCNGNGSSCLGCDGKPYGINFYDKCGICGGNSMSCYNPCNTTNCTLCLTIEGCSWCPVEGNCIFLLKNETCLYANESAQGVNTCEVQPVLTPEAIVGLSAGVIAAIVIAIVIVLAVTAGVSGRMIYVRYHKSQAPQDIVQNNPIYENKTTEQQNPVYGTELPKD